MHAAIVCGLGGFGASAARRIEREHGDRATCLAIEGALEKAQVAGKVVDAAKTLLAHPRMAVARDAPGEDGLTELFIVLVASAGETAVRAVLADAIEAIESRLVGELAPIFEPFRTGTARNAIIVPLVVMPYPAGHAEGAEIARSVRALVERVRDRPPLRRCTPQVWLVEDVAEFSILSERELQQNVRNFVTVLLRARQGLRDLPTLLHGANPKEPIATFACAVAELPREKLARWGTNRVALELLDAVLDAKQEGATLGELDALEEVELHDLDRGGDPVHVVRDLLARYAPKIEPDAPPTWWEPSEDIRARYGPDHGDPSLDDGQPPPDPPIGFALDRMRGVEDAWRLLQRRRFDDLVARDRAGIESARDALLERVEKRVDRELWSSPSPDSFRRATELVVKLRRAIGAELEEAVAERDAARPAVAPSFESFRDAHATLLDGARRKPDLGRMIFWGALTVLGAIALGPTVLWALADATGASEADWYEPLLRAHGAITSGAIALVVGGALLALRMRSRFVDLVEAHAAMWRALEQTVHGPDHRVPLRGTPPAGGPPASADAGSTGSSVLQYFASRLSLARLTARIEALLAVRASLDRDHESLQLADRAARRTRAGLRTDQQALGAIGADGRDAAHNLLAAGTESLVEPLTAPSAARAIERQMPVDARPTRIADVMRSLADREGWAKRWREEVPFSSIEGLRAASAPQAAAISAWDPFAEGADAEATAERIAAFVRRQARSLHVALDFVGHETDASDVRPVYQGVAIVPPAACDAVRRLLATEGAAGRGILPCERGVEPDRAYYLVVVTDVALERIASLRTPRRDSAAPLPRFEVERESRERDFDRDDEPRGGR